MALSHFELSMLVTPLTEVKYCLKSVASTQYTRPLANKTGQFWAVSPEEWYICEYMKSTSDAELKSAKKSTHSKETQWESINFL